MRQKALDVDSSRVSSAIQNLIKSWKASDTESDQATETSSNGRQPLNGHDAAFLDSAGPKGKTSSSNGSSGPDPPGDDEQQQQEEKRNRLLSLFYRGRKEQLQPEELMPLRVTTNPNTLAIMFASIV